MGDLLRLAQSYITASGQDESHLISGKLLPSPFWYLLYYAQNVNGNTELHICMANLPARKSSVECLIKTTWPPSLLNIVNYDGMTALHIGATGSEPAIVRQLLVAGAHPFIKNNAGFTPLHYAAMNGNVAMIKALTQSFDLQEITKMLSRKLVIPNRFQAVNMRNNDGATPLWLATDGGHLDAMKLLLELGADINVEDSKTGDRPLHIAIQRGHKHITQFLLDYYKDNPDENLRFYSSFLDLMKSLKRMGLDKIFIKTFKLPINTGSSQSESDSE